MVFYDNLGRWDEDGVGKSLKRKGIYGYIKLNHFTVQEKPTEHCKAIIFLFKKKNNSASTK